MMLFHGNFRLSFLQIRYTDSERTAASATEFVKGVFGKEDAANVWYQTPTTPDPLLRV